MFCHISGMSNHYFLIKMSNKLANYTIAYSLNFIKKLRIKKYKGHYLSSGKTFLCTNSTLLMHKRDLKNHYILTSILISLIKTGNSNGHFKNLQCELMLKKCFLKPPITFRIEHTIILPI